MATPHRHPVDRPRRAAARARRRDERARRPWASSPSRSGLPKSTTSRLVGALERQGLVQRDAVRGASPRAGASAPTPAGRRRAATSSNSRRGASTGSPGVSGETVNLGVATADAGRDARPARQPPHPRLHELGRARRPEPRLGRRQGVPRRGRRAVPRRSRSSGSPRARSPIRPRSRATSSGSARAATRSAVDELEPGLWAVAAPVRDAGGAVVAALSISGADRPPPRRPPRRARRARPGRGLYAVSPQRLRRPETRCCMSDEEIDLNALSDEELVTQMHDDLYDGLAPEIAEGTNILLARGWAPDRVLNDALVERDEDRRDRLPRRHPLRPRGAARRERDEGRDGDPAAAARGDRGRSGSARS